MQVENDVQELRGDLKTWLMTQAEDGPTLRDNPFAYAIGNSQTRFGDDFDHERMARYDVYIPVLLLVFFCLLSAVRNFQFGSFFIGDRAVSTSTKAVQVQI